MRLFILVPLLALTMAAQAADTNTNAPIAWEDLGAKATAQYKGDGLAIVATPEGSVRLRCDFQKLEGEATSEGLWLSSTAPGAASRFRVVAAAVGREGGMVAALPQCGEVSGGDAAARFVRPGVVEEYFVSVDGVRQDFVVPSRPEGTGALRLELAVSGARAQSAAPGVELVLADSGRKLAYNRLRVVDATGRELAATLSAAGENRLVVGVADASAQYPVRIDPTFSDANWISGIPGANTNIFALAVDGSGNLYAGGLFTVIGGVPANYIAKWNGSTWSSLGGGAQAGVRALAVAGTNLFVGGEFTSVTNTGNTSVAGTSRIAQWNGSAWSALGGGAQGNVFALEVSGTNLYVGGGFSTVYVDSPGTTPVTGTQCIAQWNGSAWSALGSGVNLGVRALALSGTNLYVGGSFTTAGTNVSSYLAQFNGVSVTVTNSLVVTNATVARAPNTPLKIPISALATDGNGNPVTIQSVGASTQGATITFDSTYLYYQPTNNATDTFAFTVSNGSGTATGTLTINTVTDSGNVRSVTVTGGSATLRCFGIPGVVYDMQRTTSLTVPIAWTLIASALAPGSDGSFTLTDTNAPDGAAYYRLIQH